MDDYSPKQPKPPMPENSLPASGPNEPGASQPKPVPIPSLAVENPGEEVIYQNVQEREVALQLLQATLRKHESDGDGQTTAACEVREQVARILHDLSRYQCAGQLWHQNLVIRGQLLGPDHPHTIRSCVDWNRYLLMMGNLAQAEVGLRHVLKWQERMLGPEHPDTLTSMHNLGFVDLCGAPHKSTTWA